EAAPSRQLQEAEIARLLAEVRRERCSLLLERRLTESILPEVARARVRASFAGRVFEDAELERELGNMQSMLADLSTAGLIRGHGYEKPAISQMITEAEKVQAAFDGMFDLEIDSGRLG